MRAKLAALIFIPLAAVLVLATVRLAEVGDRAGDAGRVADLAALGTDLSRLSGLLHDERTAALGYLADSSAADTGYREAVKAVDAQAQLFQGNRAVITEIPGLVTERLQVIEAALKRLPEVRDGIEDRSGTVTDVAQRYSETLAGLSGFENTVSRIADPGAVTDALRTVAAFSRVEAASAQQATITFVARTSGGLNPERQQAIVAAQVARQEALTDLRSVATEQQIALVDTVIADDAVARADALSTRAGDLGATAPNDVSAAFATVTGLLRAADTQLGEQAVAAAEDSAKAGTQRFTLEFVLVLLVLLAAVAVAFYLGRSMHLSVRRLREGALAVANRDLPEAVTRLQDVENLGEGGVDRIVAQTRDPIRVTEDDEFGQVAEAFNMVHREAIRVAAEQAALRTSVSTMFLSLARRSQTLVDRMIGELDQIERMEEDPKRLARLFELDHLATRMRRNDENLLVLAGAEVGAPRREDALLIDAVRAAQSEVELYHRIEFGSIDTDVLVTAAAVNDVVRLIAELLDNASRFSPPSTVVMAHGSRVGDHAVVQVEDRGLGISDDQMDQINRRLNEPNEVDVSAFRLMGFAVIARLAARHGIQVELRPGGEGGTIAEIVLPADIVVVPGGPAIPAPARAASWTRPGPAPQTTSGPPRTGFGNMPRPETRPPIRTAPMPSEPLFRKQVSLGGPVSDLDLEPTPDRPPLPARTPGATPSPATSSGSGFVPASPAVFPTSPAVYPASHADFPASPAVFPGSSADLPVSSSALSASSADEQVRLEMQTNWFDQTEEAQRQFGMPTAGYAPAPISAAPAAPSVSAPPFSAPPGPGRPISVPPAATQAPTSIPAPTSPAQPARINAATSAAPAHHANPSVPKPRQAPEDRWRTTADDGWQRAMAASVPADGGTTRSGLPKRVPQAQLVPGGVQNTPRAQHRRNPDEVRGLLSSYHRGVQRGRTDGVADSAAATHGPKENEQ
jgi:signal transduction histidine kinase